MKYTAPQYIKMKGRLVDVSTPLVMGILNITPDSFFSGSRTETDAEIEKRLHTLVADGAGMIDVGAYSSRPGAADVSPEEEMKRLAHALELINRLYPDMPVSVDTFRADVARRCVEDYGVDVINDISGGELDKKMFDTVADLKVPYILMHMIGRPQDMQQHTEYDNYIKDVFFYLSERVNRLRHLGVADIIIDPGFGFSKTLDQNYELMTYLREMKQTFNAPLLVGISRKSMIYRLLGTTPEEALNGTTVLNTIALMGGANILRVHDVKAAVEAVKITSKFMDYQLVKDNVF